MAQNNGALMVLPTTIALTAWQSKCLQPSPKLLHGILKRASASTLLFLLLWWR